MTGALSSRTAGVFGWRAACAAAALAGLAGVARAQIPAFPGAEGFGAYARGGRGGDVYVVTNTNSSGAGSLADGITTAPAGGRTIVFAVSGYANISGTLRVVANNITIAGQTAPGDGFGLRNGTFRVTGDNLVVRHLRFRNGNSADCINVDEAAENTIFDHCDVMFSHDENMSSFDSPPDLMTLQWSTNAWGLETHSAGGLWDLNRGTVHHTLWAHNHTRNPKARSDGLLDWINNVTFDWDIGFILGDSSTPANWKANAIGNYFISTSSKSRAFDSASLDRDGNFNFHLYVGDNLFDGNANGVLDGTDRGWSIVGSTSVEQLDSPVPTTAGVPVTPDSPLTAYKKIISAVGPLRLDGNPARPLRDEVTSIVVNNLVTQRKHRVTYGQLSGVGASNGGFGTLISSPAPADTDADGIPDYFERAVGLSPTAASHNGVLPSAGGVVAGLTFFPANTPAGYTNLEEYLHFLAIPHAAILKSTGAAPTAVDTDLRKFTSGFTSSPVFTIANIIGGTADQSGPGGALVHFTPTPDYTGRARFEFTVTDAQGASWTQTFAIVLSPDALPADPVSVPLIWKGNNSAHAWNTTASNLVWLDGETLVPWGQTDSATFNDDGFNSPNIAVAGSLQVSSLTVDASKNYTFTGSGALVGAIQFTKRGPGTVTFNNTGGNSFALDITLDGGTVVIGNGSGFGNGPVNFLSGTLTSNYAAGTAYTLSNPLTVPAGGTATVNLSARMNLSGAAGGGTLQVNVPGTTADFEHLNGSWSGFTGTLNLTGTVSNALLSANFNGGGFNNLSNATVNLANLNLGSRGNSGGNTLNIGALNGDATSRLGGAHYAGRLIYSIGALNKDMTFAGAITNSTSSTDSASGSETQFTKVGTGAMILSGVSNHTGNTTVSAGRLLVNGTLGNTTVNVSANATLGGNGTINNGNGKPVTFAANSTVAPGNATGAAGTLKLGPGGLTLNGARLQFDLGANPAAGNDALTLNGGNLTLTGNNAVQLSLLDGALGAGTYNLITGGANTNGGLANLSLNVTNTRQTLALNTTTPGAVRLQVTGNPATLVWSGGNGTWEPGPVNNWANGGAGDRFYNLDAVLFDDTASDTSVLIPGAAAPLPASVTFSNDSKSYSILGNGPITGSAKLIKNGSGPLSVLQTNTYTGGTIINGGVVTMGGAAALGTGPVTLNGGQLVFPGNATVANNVTVNAPSTLAMASGGSFLNGGLAGGGNLLLQLPAGTSFTPQGTTAGYTGVLTAAGSGTLRFNNSSGYGLANAVLDLQGTTMMNNRTTADFTLTLGALAGAAGTTVRGSDQAGSLDTTCTLLLGGLNRDTIFAGAITNSFVANSTAIQQKIALTKTGTGIFTLAGNNTYTGDTLVDAGTLRVSGVLASHAGVTVAAPGRLELAGGLLEVDSVTVSPGSTLQGYGLIVGDLTVLGQVEAAGGGTLTIQGNLTNEGTMRFRGGSGLAVTGTFFNNGVLDVITGAASLPENFVNNGTVLDSSEVRIQQFEVAGGTAVISLQTRADHVYQLQRAASPAGPWTDVGPPRNGGGYEQFSDPDAGGAARVFYRVRVDP